MPVLVIFCAYPCAVGDAFRVNNPDDHLIVIMLTSPLIILEIPEACDEPTATAVSKVFERCWAADCRWFILDLRLRTRLCRLLGPVITKMAEQCQADVGGVILLTSIDDLTQLVSGVPELPRSTSVVAALDLAEQLSPRPVRLRARFAEQDVLSGNTDHDVLAGQTSEFVLSPLR